MKFYKFFKKFLSEHLKNIYVVLFLKILLMLIPFLFPYFTKLTIDEGLIAGSYRMVLIASVATIIAVMIRQTILMMSFRFESRVSTGVVFSLRKKLSDVLLSQSISFFEKRNQGDLLTIMNSDTERVEGYAINTMYSIVLNSIQLVAAIIILFVMNYKLALIACVPIGLFPLTKKVFVSKLKELSETERGSVSSITGLFQQVFSNIYVVLAFNLRDRISDKLTKESYDLTAARVKSSTYSGLLGVIVAGVLQITTSVIVYMIGGYSVIKGEIAVGSLIAFSLYLNYCIGPVSFFYRIKPTMANINSSIESILGILSLSTDIKDTENSVDIKAGNYAIEFENVDFSYNDDSRIFEKFTCKIEPGSMVALCGDSGSGKSTLIKLLLRFHEVDNGVVSIGDKNINDIKIESLRTFFSVVPQDSYFFNKSILENFRMIKPDVTEHDLDELINLVDLKKKIDSMPEGYKTVIGDQGTLLSGGERQRLSIARALVRDSSVLILDEATSQLDSSNEQNIIELIRKINNVTGKTIIMVAHKLTTISRFDKIIILQNGKIIEDGNHHELLESKGKYYEMWNAK